MQLVSIEHRWHKTGIYCDVGSRMRSAHGPGKFRTYSEPDFLEAGSPRLFRVSQFPPSEPRSEYMSLTRISNFSPIGAILFDPATIVWLETAQEIQLEIRWLISTIPARNRFNSWVSKCFWLVLTAFDEFRCISRVDRPCAHGRWLNLDNISDLMVQLQDFNRENLFSNRQWTIRTQVNPIKLIETQPKTMKQVSFQPILMWLVIEIPAGILRNFKLRDLG